MSSKKGESMNKTEQLEYGIQYEVIKLNEKSYILFPLTIIDIYFSP